nr:MAG TPA: hyaluronidase [Caudoviricetes sp.]
MADRIQQRRDAAARWAQYNPILLEGEVGYVTDDPNQYKIGDGVHTWNELPLRGFDGTLVHTLGNSQTAAMSQKGVTYIVASGSDTSEMEVKRTITGGNVVGVPFLIKKGLMYTVSIESDGTTEGQVYTKPFNEGGKPHGTVYNTGTLSFIAVDDYDSVNVFFPAGSTGNVTVKVRIGNKERFENIENGLSENGFLNNAKGILSTPNRVERELSSRSIDMEADFLNKGNLVTIGIETPDTSDVVVFVYDGTNHVGVTTFFKSGKITIRCYADFQYIRFYNNSTEKFSCYIEKATEYSEVKYTADEVSWYFQNRNSEIMDITWKNAGMCWSESGNKITNSAYDISEPIDVSGFSYYGFVGKLNANNYAIVSVDEEGNFAGKVLQKGVIEYQINGISLYIFKIPSSVSYISLSSFNSDKLFTKLFKLKSPFLMRMLDTMDVVEDNLGSSSSSSNTGSKTLGRAIEFYTPVASGQSFTVEINKTTHWDGKSVAIFGFKNSTEYDNLGSFFENSQRKTFTAQNDYTFIKLYDNNDKVGGYSATLKIENKVEQIENKVEQIENKAKQIENKVEQLSPVIDYFKSSKPIVKELVWKDAGGFWDLQGNITTDSSYDYSEPVDVSDFKYFGLYGKLHKNNYTVVAVTKDNKFDRYVLQKGILEWQNTDNSLYIFKVPSDVNYISVSVANIDKSTVELFELKSPFLIDILDKMGKSNEYLFGLDSLQRSSTGTANRTVVVPYPIKKDKWYKVRLTTSSNSYVGDIYTTPHPTPAYGNVNKNSPVLKLKAIADETAVRCFIHVNGDETSQSVTVSVRELGIQETSNSSTSESDRQYKVLILGDSYSQNNGPWVKGMQEWLNITSLVNLGVSSCSVKDKYQDRNTYPYTSRPVQANSTGNLNTLGCQIEKLKRLMAGTDLDSRENKIYETEDEYPNVIIIEGGMNDSFDTDEKEKTYYAQFEKAVSGVYIQQSSSKEATQGTCYIQTPIDEVDRTCYAGAYRYVVESLLTLFPKAQIFITTCSGLGYWNGSVVEKRYRTAVQQRKCANLCAATVIDWSAEGQISSILTHPQGSGTQEDPYTWGQCTLPNADSGDLMHPNTKGGKKYGHLAALVIKQRFLDIENM